MWAYESWVHTVRCSEQLDNSPVTQLKVCKPFYLLNAAFLPLLPDHSPSFSHNAIATSCIRATPYSSSNTLSPAASSLKRHKYCFGLYQTFTTQPLHPISSQFNTFNQYFQSILSFQTHLNIFSLSASTFYSSPLPAASVILWPSPQRKAEFAPHAPGRVFQNANTCPIYQEPVLGSRKGHI